MDLLLFIAFIILPETGRQASFIADRIERKFRNSYVYKQTIRSMNPSAVRAARGVLQAQLVRHISYV
jgi:hypothetical protein